jgi:hypothetical protein
MYTKSTVPGWTYILQPVLREKPRQLPMRQEWLVAETPLIKISSSFIADVFKKYKHLRRCNCKVCRGIEYKNPALDGTSMNTSGMENMIVDGRLQGKIGRLYLLCSLHSVAILLFCPLNLGAILLSSRLYVWLYVLVVNIA